MKKTICHITTVHPRCDVRILYKECKSLTEKYDVNLIVADGLGDEVKDGIKIYDIHYLYLYLFYGMIQDFQFF